MQTMFKRNVQILKGDQVVDEVTRNVIKRSYRDKTGLVRYQKLWRTAVPCHGNLPDNHKEKIWIVELDAVSVL